MFLLREPLVDKTVFGLALAFPFLLVLLVPYDGYWIDIEIFGLWADCLGEYGRSIYLDCTATVPNYPSVGILFSAGLMRLTAVLSGANDPTLFRLFIAVFDAANIALLALLASTLRLPRPLLIGAFLFALPSTLVDGAFWGQIDNTVLTFCLIATLAFVSAWRTADAGSRYAWLAVAGATLAACLLIKQLTIFSGPFFLALLLITAVVQWKERGAGRAFAALGVFSAAFIVVFAALDRVFAVPPDFFGSGYYFIWTAGGSSHGDLISNNGFNIWTLLGVDPLSSSHEPFTLTWKNHVTVSVTPHVAGMVLFAGLTAFLMGSLAWFGCSLPRSKEIGRLVTGPIFLSTLLLFHGLVHLAFNVALTGTHERYMYIGYPYILLAAFALWGQGLVGWRMASFCVFCAGAVGAFMFSVIAPLPGVLFLFKSQQFLAALHLFLLVVLIDAWRRLLSPSGELAASVGQPAPTAPAVS